MCCKKKSKLVWIFFTIQLFIYVTLANSQTSMSRHIYSGNITKTDVVVATSNNDEVVGYVNISIPEISLSDMPGITVYAKHASDTDWRILNSGNVKDGTFIFPVEYTSNVPDLIWQYKIIVIK